MLPVTHGVDRTRREVVRYALATWAVSMIPALLNRDWIYGAIAFGAGAWFVVMALRLQRMAIDADMDRYARRLFAFSISYLFLIFTALLLGKAAVSYGLV
jgi:protoheme IX farnesyltransferase